MHSRPGVFLNPIVSYLYAILGQNEKKGRNFNDGHVYEVKSSIDFFLLGPFMDGAFGINPVFTEP